MEDRWIIDQLNRLISSGKQAMDNIVREKGTFYDNRPIEEMKQDALSYGAGVLARQYLGISQRKGSKYAKSHMKGQEFKKKSEMFGRFDRMFDNWVNDVVGSLGQISEWKNNLEPSGNSNALISRFHNRIRYKNSDTNFRHGVKFLESLKHRDLIRNSDIATRIQDRKERKRKPIPDRTVSIIEKRRQINQIIMHKHGFELFKPNEMAIIDLGKGCRNEDDFTNRIQSLATLIDGMDAKSLKQSILGKKINHGSINALQAFLNEHYSGYDGQIIRKQRNIMSMRSKKFPVHQDNPAFIKTLKNLGFTRYPPNWSRLWDTCKDEYHSSLKKLHACINKP